MKIDVGQHAPSIKAFDSDKQEFNLEDHKGKKVLLLFFPAAFTSVCTQEMCMMRDDLSFYNNLNANIVGISTDSLFVLDQYKKENSINFTLVSDYNKDISEAYGTAYDEFVFGMKGTSKRGAFVIDEDGIVRYAEVLDKATDLPDFDAIK
ncbi:MAG: redoxin domain-containing protein, partial [Bacteroidia bacterium]|nr:redoxin domain-containing protein [Bacteroidia bacterium]NNM15482.1 redoxin domain-containing protein [Bacteroidia bacterium]